jgi:hypothetical protein
VFGNCRELHLTITIRPMDGEAVRGSHLRQQRRIGGFSVKTLADAARISPTRVRQIEDSDRVTAGAVTRYLEAVAQAWRARAEETAVEEVAAR